MSPTYESIPPFSRYGQGDAHMSLWQILKDSGYDPDVAPFPGLPALTKGYNAALFTGATNEAKITAAIAKAVTDGKTYVWVPQSMLPYNASLVTFNNAVKMLAEGTNPLVYDFRAYGAAATGTNELPALQATLNAANGAGGGTVVGSPTGTNVYATNASLVIYSNTILSLEPGVTIRLLAGSSSNMIHNNAWVTGSGRDTNITIKGGSWDRLNNGGVGQQNHSILLQRVDGVTVEDMTVVSTAGKFSINLYACTAFVVDQITLNCFSDGVHISGASSNGMISNIRGIHTGDDSVAFTPTDYAYVQNGDFGDITDIEIKNIYTQTSGTAVHLISGTHLGTTYNLKRFKIQNVNANAGASALAMAGDVADGDTQNGNYADIEASQIVQRGSGSCVRVYDIGTGTFRNLELSQIGYADGGTGKETIAFDNVSAAVTVENVTIRDCFWTGATNNTSPIVLSAATINHLTLQNLVANTPGGTSLVSMTGVSPTIGTLKIVDCKVNIQTTSGNFVSNGGATTPVLTDLHITNCTASRCAHAIGDLLSSTNIYVNGLSVGTVNDLLNVRATATVTFRSADGITGTNSNVIANAGTLVGAFLCGRNIRAVPTYSASITPDCFAGALQVIPVSNTTAFTINAPINAPAGAQTGFLTVEIVNNSGGVMGVITWNALFTFFGGAFVNPASTFKRSVNFAWNGNKWLEISRASADYA